MKKRIILILSALILLVGCETGQGAVEEPPKPPVTVEEETHEETQEESTTDEKDNSILENNEEASLEEENTDFEEKDQALSEVPSEVQGDDVIPEETLAMERGLTFQDDRSLLAVLPMNSEEDLFLKESDLPIKDFHILLFTTMDEGETEDFLLIPRYVGTTIRLYESGDEGTLPIYSYVLDKRDVVLLRIGACKRQSDYRIVVSYEGEEATWILSEEEGEGLLLEDGFEQIY